MNSFFHCENGIQSSLIYMWESDKVVQNPVVFVQISKIIEQTENKRNILL